jgi:hypothetical protein
METVCRMITKLRKRGLIEMPPRTHIIRLCDPLKLAGLAVAAD